MENHTIKRARAYYYRDLYQHRARWLRIAHYRTSLSLQPNAQAHFDLALTYLALGDIATAEETYAEALASYGHTNAESKSARTHLERFVALGIQREAAQSLVKRYFTDW